MTTIQLQLPFDTLLNSLQQLDLDELSLLTQHATRLQAQRRAPSLSQAETELLFKIGQGVVPQEIKRRCAQLTEKQRTLGLTNQEQSELMQLVDEIETLNARRLGYLAELANIRQIPVDELMNRLGIEALTYG